MKLWLLEYREGLPLDDDPWEPWFDKTFALVIRAKSEHAARRLASDAPGHEGKQAWLDERYSQCVPLTAKGDEGVIIRDSARA